MSSAITRLSRSNSGTSPETIRWARPSTMAVLPTPGSPISTGLFLVRRESTWITRRISSSRPITGSSLPSSAISVRARPNRSSGLSSSSGAAGAAGAAPLAIVPPIVDRAEGCPGLGGRHQVLAAAVGDRELRAEGPAHLLELLGQSHLGVQRLQLDLLDARVHLGDLLLQVEDPLHTRQVQPQIRGHLLNAPQLVDVLLRIEPRALR